MISTVETRRFISIELDRSEVFKMLHGAEINGHVQVRDKSDGVRVDVKLYCSDPEDFESNPAGAEEIAKFCGKGE